LIRRQDLAFAHDLVVTCLSFVVSFYLRVGGEAFGTYAEALLTGAPTFAVIAAFTYRAFGLYRGIWRYSSTPDLLNLVRAVSVAIGLLLLAMFLVNRLDPIPRSVPVINWFVLIVMLGGPRLMYRIVKDRRLAKKQMMGGAGRTSVLLVGSDLNAELFIRSLAADVNAAYRVCGVLDRKPINVGRAIHGVKVLGTIDDLEKVVADLTAAGEGPQRVVISYPGQEIKGEVTRNLLERCDALGLTLSRLPSLTDFRSTEGAGSVALRPIAIEDLLGRPQVQLDREPVSAMVTGARVLVTGAGGSIGSELCHQIASDRPSRLILVDHSEFQLYTIHRKLRETFPDLDIVPILCDVRQRSRVMRLFQKERPNLVFHAAALKHVPIVETHIAEGIATNCLGTRNVADAARHAGARSMVFISTDKAVRPVSVMGATKRLAEAYCQAMDVQESRRIGERTRYITVRFGNVLGSSGSVVPLFQAQLAAGGPITVTHPEVERYFMTIAEAVQLVLQASAFGLARAEEAGRIFVLDMGKPVKIVDLARQMIRLAGLRPDRDVRIEYTGLRPGEKLYEELFDPVEQTLPTPVEGVFVASPLVIDYGLLARSLEEMERAVADEAVERLVAMLRAIVPGYAGPVSPSADAGLEAPGNAAART